MLAVEEVEKWAATLEKMILSGVPWEPMEALLKAVQDMALQAALLAEAVALADTNEADMALWYDHDDTASDFVDWLLAEARKRLEDKG